MNFFRRTLAATLFIAVSAFVSGQQTITLMADYWMPYNGDGVKESGYIIDIAKAIFEPAGYKIKFVMIPWSRALVQARAGEVDGVVGALAADAKDFIFPKEEQGVAKNSFFVNAGASWTYSGIPSLGSVQLGCIGDYAYFSELDKYIKSNGSRVTLMRGDNPLFQMIQMMMFGRLDAIIEDEAVMKFTLSSLKLSDKIVGAGSEGTGESLYIAFSPVGKNSVTYARILSDGMTALRNSGKLAVILAKYGLKDWK